MKENNQRNSRKRLNALILLVAFTAILLIVSTYAWFSTQKNVKLSGLDGKVNVAEGLQISLDALNWTNSIDLSTDGIEKYFRQTNIDANKTTEETKYNLKKPYDDRTNLVPNELIPASTTAKQGTGENNLVGAEGIGLGDLKFYSGTNTNGIELGTIAPVEYSQTAGFYSIDFFLQNATKTSVTANDVLQLTDDSSIQLTGTKNSTGFQNTFRVAFAIYDDNDTQNQKVVASETTNQANIIAATTGAERKITDVAIWEPNAYGEPVMNDAPQNNTIKTYGAHVTYIIQNNNRLTLSAGDQEKADLDGTSRFTGGTKLPTYALTAASVNKTLTDIYNWDSTSDLYTRE